MDDLDLGATIKGFSPGQKVFKRYTLQKILGRGGMGVVWLARDEELEIEIALKFLPEIVALDKESVAELKRETRRNLSLTHPHIVRVYDFIQGPNTAAISMEYVDGSSLSALKVDQPGHVFPLERLSPWIGQLCAALDYAHGSARIVHRDLKPANLMVNARDELKVTDFGIARSVADSVSRVSAQAGGTSGTPVYMSPQQMMGEDPAVTDDIYAIGATLYELLTGKPPFHSGNIMMQVQSKVPPLVNERRASLGLGGPPVPAALERALAACLAKDPKDRPQSAGELAKALLAEQAIVRPPPPAPVSEPALIAPGTKSGTVRYITLAAGAAALAVAGWYFGIEVPARERQAAEKRAADAAAQAAEENRRAEEQRRAEETRKQEQARQAEEARKQAEARKADENRRAEEARIAEEKRKAEEARKPGTTNPPARPDAAVLRAARDRIKAGTGFARAAALIDTQTQSIFGVPWVLRTASRLQVDGRSLILPATGVRVAVVDLAKLYDSDPKTEAANAKFQQEQTEAQQTLDQLNAAGQRLVDEYKEVMEGAKNPALTADARAKAESSAQALLQRITQKQAEVEASRKSAQETLQAHVRAHRDQLLQEIISTLKARLGDTADLVFDKSGPSLFGIPPILYSDPGYDLTDAALAGRFGSGGAGPSVKVVVVDVARLYDGHYKVVEMKAKLEADNQRAQQQLEEMNKEGQTMVDDYKQLAEQAKNPVLNAAARSTAEAKATDLLVKIQEKQKEMEDFRTSTQRALAQRQRTFRDVILEELTKIIADTAKRRGATLVLDVSAPGLDQTTFAEAGPLAIDLTDDVQREVAKDAPAAPAKSTAPIFTVPGLRKP